MYSRPLIQCTFFCHAEFCKAAFHAAFWLLLLQPLLGRVLIAISPQDEAPANEAGIAYYENHIRPLLFQHCYSCHSATQQKREGDLWLDSPEAWLKGGDQGAAVVPGDVDASLLIRAVRYQDASLQMPPAAPLPPDQIAKLEKWIALGAPAPVDATPSGLLSPSDPIAGKEHWAFQPLRKAEDFGEFPDQTTASPIDSQLQRGQVQENIQSVGPAPPNVLIRRVSLLLTGLPPSAAEIEAFQSDPSPARYETLVDRLLSSPRFGERWGRHWLDLARYADSNGSDENFLFREAWRYRNWVFAAMNQDMPFDQFTTQQIAGDLLPFENIEQRDQQRIATGYLLLGPKVLLGNDPENQKMEIADEQIDTIGRTFFAQTLGCARCHNHKFDPIPTNDYYALAGIFTSTQVMEQRFMLNEQRVMEQLVGLGETGIDVDNAYEQYWRDRPKLGEQKTKATEALEALKKNEEAVFQSIVSSHATAISPAANETSRTIEERIVAQQKLVDELTKAWNEPPGIPPRAMISSDRDQPNDEATRIAGQFNKKGDVVPRGFLTVLNDSPRTLPPQSSGRLELAQWITNGSERSGQLTARVMANRIWYHLMGRGLVRTVDNFGRTGETPSHPELLDHLARELLDHDWSLKHLIRHIVLSDAFQRSSEYHEYNYSQDPDNTLYWRYNRRRLDPEAFRDSTLLVAGTLDNNVYLSTVDYLGDQATAVGPNTVRRRTDFPCRSVYLPVIRNDLPEIFEILDFTDPQVATGMRRQTIVPTQGLFLLNDDALMTAATHVAKRIRTQGKDETVEQLKLLYQTIVGLPASEAELKSLQDAYGTLLLPQPNSQVAQSQTSGETNDPSERALMILAHALFASSRFQFIE